MRMIARANTPEMCTKRVNELKKEGWKPITEVKLDPSPSIDMSFVCVLEREGEPIKRKGHFGGSYFGH
jgi:hypothetical protein